MLIRAVLSPVILIWLLCLTGISAALAAGQAQPGYLITYLGLTNPARSDYDILVTDIRTRITVNLTHHSASDFNFSWSPDRTRLAFLSNRGGESDIYLLNANGRDLRRLATGLNPQELAWSPDGSRIGFLAARESSLYDVYAVSVEDGTIQDLTDTMVVADTAFAWSPDGSQIIYVEENHRLMHMNADGSDRQYLTETAPGSVPAWSPDARTMAYIQDNSVTVLPLADNSIAHRKMPDGAATIYSVKSVMPLRTPTVWSPDGTLLAYVVNQDTGIVRLTTLANGDSRDYPTGLERIREMAWSPDGTRLVLAALPAGAAEVQQIYLLTLADGQLIHLTNASTFYRGAVWK